jgi:hypothetical protein
MKMQGNITVDLPGLVRVARNNGWTAAQLAQAFHDMPIEIAQALLEGALTMHEDGSTTWRAE